MEELTEKRWSPRAFKDEVIDDKIIKKFFENGKHVASSYNEQPWSFIVAKKGDDHYEKLFDALNEFNQSWANTAPVLVAGIARNKFSNNDKNNLHKKYDLGAFVTAGTLAILEDEYYVHQMAGFDADKISNQFNVSKEYEPTVMFVIGKIGDVKDLPSELQKQETPESPRKELNEFVYGKEFGTKYF